MLTREDAAAIVRADIEAACAESRAAAVKVAVGAIEAGFRGLVDLCGADFAAYAVGDFVEDAKRATKLGSVGPP